MRKHFGSIPGKITCNTFKYTTQHGVLPHSSYLQEIFKSPNLVLNLQQRKKGDATDQIFSDTPSMDDGKTSAHVFVGQDSKITDVYKSKDNSGKEFLGVFQDRVRTRGVPTKLVADNAPMYRGWKVTKYMYDLWQCETIKIKIRLKTDMKL